MKSWQKFLFLAAAFLSSSNLLHAQQKPSSLDVAKAFADVMSPHGPIDANYIRKWGQTIHVSVLSSGNASLSLISLLGQTFQEVEKQTKTKIDYATSTTNFAVIFLNNPKVEIDKYRPIMKFAIPNENALTGYIEYFKSGEGECSSVIGDGDQKKITFYFLIVSVAEGKRQNISTENCLVRGVLSGMGFGTGNTDRESVFNPLLNLDHMTEVDRSLLRNFYSEQIKTGALIGNTQATFKAVVESDTGH